jgi:feruloyl-CoA synthase
MCNFLPWSHTYGAHSILHNMLDWGGTLYIDEGAPTPARLPAMIRNLKDVPTTQHTTVPAAWAALATELERDQELADAFFSRLVCMAYGGASMGQDIYERIQAVAVRTTGERISLSAGYGATETAPTASNVHWPNDRMGLIGLPLPGNTFKMVPNGEKMELRVKGVNITPGYYRNPDKTAEAFDEEGYYKLGDAVKFVDPDNPERGLAFRRTYGGGIQTLQRHMGFGGYCAGARGGRDRWGLVGCCGLRPERGGHHAAWLPE